VRVIKYRIMRWAGHVACVGDRICAYRGLVGNLRERDHLEFTDVVKQAWSGPEGSRKLRFPDFLTTAEDGGKVVSLTHRPPLPPENTPGTHFCWRLSRPQGHSAIGRSMSTEKIQ
jgi:hypothetical protein